MLEKEKDTLLAGWLCHFRILDVDEWLKRWLTDSNLDLPRHIFCVNKEREIESAVEMGEDGVVNCGT